MRVGSRDCHLVDQARCEGCDRRPSVLGPAIPVHVLVGHAQIIVVIVPPYEATTSVQIQTACLSSRYVDILQVDNVAGPLHHRGRQGFTNTIGCLCDGQDKNIYLGHVCTWSIWWRPSTSWSALEPPQPAVCRTDGCCARVCGASAGHRNICACTWEEVEGAHCPRKLMQVNTILSHQPEFASTTVGVGCDLQVQALLHSSIYHAESIPIV
mmetsp:Transcript_13609/g.32016  ORF Transcript_13609/g.32016 Transcript_13609/m.32016 type:complete len:211 (+) Transcript_13609:502-1134(+)